MNIESKMINTLTPASCNRRRFLGVATMTAAAVGMTGLANARSSEKDAADSNANMSGPLASFSALKQIKAGLLDVGYADEGPADGRPVMLLHGWPYDIYSYVDVAPLLTARGYRVIVPYLRGHGTTRFLSDDTVRNGQQAVTAVDIVNLMDALKIQKAIIGGFDCRARRTCQLHSRAMARAM